MSIHEDGGVVAVAAVVAASPCFRGLLIGLFVVRNRVIILGNGVVKREDVDEDEGLIVLELPTTQLKARQSTRFCGRKDAIASRFSMILTTLRWENCAKSEQ